MKRSLEDEAGEILPLDETTPPKKKRKVDGKPILHVRTNDFAVPSGILQGLSEEWK